MARWVCVCVCAECVRSAWGSGVGAEDRSLDQAEARTRGLGVRRVRARLGVGSAQARRAQTLSALTVCVDMSGTAEIVRANWSFAEMRKQQRNTRIRQSWL